MASIKIVRRKNKERKDGTAPLALRMSKNYKTNYSFLGQYVLEKDWDTVSGKVKRTHPNSKKLNNFLMKKLTEANDITFETKDSISSKAIKKKIQGPGGQKSFFKFAAERIDNKYQQKVFSVAKAEMSILYNLQEYLNQDKSISVEKAIDEIKKHRKLRISKARKFEYHLKDAIADFKKNKRLSFQDVDESFIKNYKNFCKVYLEHKTRTVTNHLFL